MDELWWQSVIRYNVERIIDSYALSLTDETGVDSACVSACADDVIKATLGWDVTYDQSASARSSHG